MTNVTSVAATSELILLYRRMVTIRRCEEAVGRLFNDGLVHGTQRAWSSLRSAPQVVSAAAAPVPYSPPLEATYLPSVEEIVAVIRVLVA
jgi:pyruvate/2-oxoglutarate/acetoin dehydrogenase E1 component